MDKGSVVARTPGEHARQVIHRLAKRQYEHYMKYGFPHGIKVSYEYIYRNTATMYLDLEQRNILKPVQIDPVERERKAEEKFEKLGTDPTFDKEAKKSLVLEGKEAVEFDKIYQSAKEQTKKRTPLLTSVPGKPAKQSNIHK